MRLNKNSGLALILIALGVIFFLNIIGLNLGKLMGFIIPVAVIFLGYIGIKQGRTWIGWGIFLVGMIILLGKLSGLIMILISVGLILYGISLYKKEKNAF